MPGSTKRTERTNHFAKLNLSFIVLSYAGCFVYGLVGTARGSLFPDLLATFHLSNTEGALFFSVGSLAGLANNLLTYKWYPRFGLINGMTLSSILFALGSFLISLGQNFFLVLVGSALVGFAMGASSLLVNILAVQSTNDSGFRRQVLSGLHSMYGLSSLIAPLLINALAAGGFAWRMIFLILGATPLAAAVVSLRIKDARLQVTAQATSFFASHSWNRTLWYAAVCMLYVAVETLLTTRLALYARADLGYQMSQANFLLSGFFLMFTAGRVIFTFVRATSSNSSIMMASSIASVTFFFVGLYVNPWGLAVCGLGCSVFYPCLMALLSDEMGDATPVAMTWCQIAQSLGTVAMHEAVGWLSDRFGLRHALLFGPACFAGVLLLLMFRNPVFPRQNRSENFDGVI